jgi:tRNA nucleotidyltransferase (CCA-adding enzyme)
VFLAGGVVRDLLLGRGIHDVDLVVEGDAGAFARSLAALLGGTVRIHERFGTATVTLPDGVRLDVAATRTERYSHPGALPDVARGAPIAGDLRRRDFTVNAMALGLAAPGVLVDPFGGRRDLERGVLRILHPSSFSDDPTRALRAVRYAARLGLELDPATRRSLREAIRAGALDRISADRLRREVRLVLEEACRADAVRRMGTLGLDAAVHPALGRRAGALVRLRRAGEEAGRPGPATTWLCYLLAWMGKAGEDEARGVARRLGLSGAEGRRVLAWPGTVARLSRGLARRAPAEVRRLARELSPDERVAVAAGLGRADAAAFRAASGSALEPLPIRGSDLRNAGVAAGPAIGRALARTRAALEDGRIGPAQALEFALGIAREEET